MQPNNKRRLTSRQRSRLRRRRRCARTRGVLLLLTGLIACIAVGWFVLRPVQPDPTQVLLRSLPTPAPTPDPNATPTPEPTEAPTPSPVPTPEPTAAPSDAPTAEPEATPLPTEAPTRGPLRSARLRVAGDILCGEEQLAFARSGSQYDFAPQFSLLSGSLGDADYTIANLETTLGKYKKKNYSGYPRANAPESLAEDIADTGIDLLTLANDHMLDRWFDGMVSTVDAVEAAGLDHCGAARTQQERDLPTVIDINGISFGFLAYTQTTNGMEQDSSQQATEFGVPYLRRADFSSDIADLRSAGAEVIVALPHWGTEYNSTPDSTQTEYARKLAEAGVDIILGSHPRVLQRMNVLEFLDRFGNQQRVFVAYSLGSLVSMESQPGARAGVIVDLTVREQEDGSFAVEDVGYIPTYSWVHDGGVQVLSASLYCDAPPEGMSPAEVEAMQSAFVETRNLMGGDFEVLEE